MSHGHHEGQKHEAKTEVKNTPAPGTALKKGAKVTETTGATNDAAHAAAADAAKLAKDKADKAAKDKQEAADKKAAEKEAKRKEAQEKKDAAAKLAEKERADKAEATKAAREAKAKELGEKRATEAEARKTAAAEQKLKLAKEREDAAAAKKVEREAALDAAKKQRDEERQKKEKDLKEAAEAAKKQRAEQAAERQRILDERKNANKPENGRRPKATHIVYTGAGLSSPQSLSIRGKVLDYIKTNCPVGEEVSIDALHEAVKPLLYGSSVRSYLSKLEEMGHVNFVVKGPVEVAGDASKAPEGGDGKNHPAPETTDPDAAGEQAADGADADPERKMAWKLTNRPEAAE